MQVWAGPAGQHRFSAHAEESVLMPPSFSWLLVSIAKPPGPSCEKGIGTEAVQETASEEWGFNSDVAASVRSVRYFEVSPSAEVVFGQGLQLVVEEGLRAVRICSCSYAFGFMSTASSVIFDCFVTKAELSSNGPAATPTPTARACQQSTTSYVARPGLVPMCHRGQTRRCSPVSETQG